MTGEQIVDRINDLTDAAEQLLQDENTDRQWILEDLIDDLRSPAVGASV